MLLKSRSGLEMKSERGSVAGPGLPLHFFERRSRCPK